MTAIPLHASYPSTGDVIDGKYRIVRVLGEGGMGMVAKADHLLRKVPVALKFIAPHILVTEGGVERFLNEAVLASQIPSDHVVGILDVGKLPSGAPYMVMEYLEGRDVAALTDDEKEVSVDRAVHLTIQILRALQMAHAVGVVHRDLKPSNCFLVRKDGEDDFVKLLDFGISKAPVSAGLTATNAALGTPLYMSPEQARNPRNVDGRGDLYSTGVILYELLGKRTPHISESGEATELILKLFTQEPARIETLRKELPDGLGDVVHRALLHDVEKRFQDAREFADALEPFAPARSKHALEKMRTFVAPDKLASPHSAPDAFDALNSLRNPQVQTRDSAADPLAATHSVSPAARTAPAVETTSRPPPARSPTWILAALAAAIVIAVIAAFKIAATPTTPPVVATTPPPLPSTIVVPPSSTTTTTTSVPMPSASVSAVPTIATPGPGPAPSTSVHLKQVGLRP